jgi:hypothetical protein
MAKVNGAVQAQLKNMKDRRCGPDIDLDQFDPETGKKLIEPERFSQEFNAAESGAQREALGVPYMKQLPLEGLAAGAAALEYGAQKYSDRNWEKGLPWQQMIDSLKRHIDDFERGRDYDDGSDGSGMHHVCMIMAGALMLSSSVIRGIGKDDRMTSVDGGAFTSKQSAKWIQEQLDLAEKFNKIREENNGT